MRKNLSMVGAVSVLGLLLANASQANAFTITQLSNQAVGNPAFPATACVDVGGASTADGAIIGPFPCNNQLNEQWIYANGQFLGLGTVGFGAGAVNKCLSIHNDSPADGTGVELDTCITGNTSQVWDLFGDSNFSEIVNLGSNKCLDSQGKIGGGLQLVIETCNGSAGQKWNLK
ncbi:MAG: ricin-type beta-trefoil lectin domain protein [Alphaproteobacteria bacterium]|nr:ricin-type beta-trefoil lectin domain protein [Alphaproteobacteria bacterium]